MRQLFFIGLVSSLVLAGIGACGDPVYDAQIKSLGDEQANVPQGEFHRAGQPCELCHSSSGPASAAPFTVAGTIFAQQASAIGVDGVTVAMTDTTGSSFVTKTNCVGNFFVRPGQWDPAFPILARIIRDNHSRTMQGQIGRERSCANCHKDPFSSYERLSSVGHVYLYSPDDVVPTPPTCPVNPRVGGGN